MRAVIDTSSLLALVRYYLPFEKEFSLTKLIQGKIKNGELILLDKVALESVRVSRGVIAEKLPVIKDKKHQFVTDFLLPEAGFIRDLENKLSYPVQKRKLGETEFENRKREFLESADAKLILFCLADKRSPSLDELILVTEESRASNDGKLFKKLPVLCELLDIGHCNLTSLLIEHFKVRMSEFLL
ncbi:MAG: DUF4411 domain-containing protein [Bacteroidota bacterium]